MPKKILFESAVHHLANASKRLRFEINNSKLEQELDLFCKSWNFSYPKKEQLDVSWTYPNIGSASFDFKEAELYVRGDTKYTSDKQKESGIVFTNDKVLDANNQFFDNMLHSLICKSGLGALNEYCKLVNDNRK